MKSLVFHYDCVADILHIDKCPPYAGQLFEDIGDDVVARLNPETNEIENIEVLFFSRTLLRRKVLELPIAAEFQLSDKKILADLQEQSCFQTSPAEIARKTDGIDF